MKVTLATIRKRAKELTAVLSHQGDMIYVDAPKGFHFRSTGCRFVLSHSRAECLSRHDQLDDMFNDMKAGTERCKENCIH